MAPPKMVAPQNMTTPPKMIPPKMPIVFGPRSQTDTFVPPPMRISLQTREEMMKKTAENLKQV